jgi:hypothetical protein
MVVLGWHMGLCVWSMFWSFCRLLCSQIEAFNSTRKKLCFWAHVTLKTFSGSHHSHDTLSLVATKSILWVLPPWQWIPCLCLCGHKRQRWIWAIHGGITKNMSRVKGYCSEKSSTLEKLHMFEFWQQSSLTLCISKKHDVGDKICNLYQPLKKVYCSIYNINTG